MNNTSLSRLATVTVATGFASLAMCAPANAMRVPDPSVGSSVPATGPSTPEPSGTNWTLVAGGGLVIVGGAAALANRRRHAPDMAHPA
jgi:hypothetical protein